MTTAQSCQSSFLYANKELARINSVKNDTDKYAGLKIINTALPLFTHGFIFGSAEYIFLANFSFQRGTPTFILLWKQDTL